ncbi:TetR/AcrR family transcriptional regulator [Lactiplantibacillus argentoratensis]|uniref:TetR/AcrR family transcriptional regulator n=1 Tax=Lactiplantibacillus argentoratensis TaxID=271881 RepID=UPI00254F1E9D|nr:TetR/AcrR family transcriptional regulator [Lactiplantibacillus argentoratensis]MDK9681543.1 TetR/AcrR family transcriptional regulator [Lactiplantibacillus argentoratensis]
MQRTMYQLLDRRSISQITVEQICRVALIHRSSFYRYYTDKFDLLSQMVMRAIEELLAVEQADMAGSAVMSRFIVTHTQILRHLLVTNTEGDNNRSQRVINDCLVAVAQTRAADRVFVMIRKSQQPDLMAYLVSGAITSIVQWLSSKNLDGSSLETQAAIESTLATVFSLEQQSL